MNVPSLEALADFPVTLGDHADAFGPMLASVNDEPADAEPVRAAA